MVSIHTLLYFVLYVVVLGLVCYLLHWLISYAGLPDPWAKIARIGLAVLAVLVLVSLLLSLLGGRPILVL
jgi:hypothetical protein